MGKPTGFMEITRQTSLELPPEERIRNFNEFHVPLHTDEQQAQWIVRSFLLFSAMSVEKGFVYFFNDKDEPKLHAASGLTRNYEPKPAYHAVAWMLKSLADYRFSKVITQSLDDGYVYEFVPGKAGEPLIWAAWHPTEAKHEITVPSSGMKVIKAERMPLKKGEVEPVSVSRENSLQLSLGERPVLIWMTPATK